MSRRRPVFQYVSSYMDARRPGERDVAIAMHAPVERCLALVVRRAFFLPRGSETNPIEGQFDYTGVSRRLGRYASPTPNPRQPAGYRAGIGKSADYTPVIGRSLRSEHRSISD